MTLENLLFKILDTTTVIITEFGEEIARYDGRESIPTELNNALVDNITVSESKLYVEIMR